MPHRKNRSARSTSVDLTTGSPYKLLLVFTFPILVGYLIQQFYSMADTAIVGWTVSPDAMAGVGLTGSISFLVFSLVFGLCGGFSVRTSIYIGAKNTLGVRRSIATSLTLCAVLTVALTLVSLLLAEPLLRLINTPARYYPYARAYLITIFAGIGASMLMNIVAGTLSALGDSRAYMLTLAVSSVLNIGLDFLFIVTFGMDYYGAAVATVLSQLLAGIASLAYLFLKYPEYRPLASDYKPELAMAKSHLATGIPLSVQYSIIAVGCIFLQAATNMLDSTHPGIVTAMTAASKVDCLLIAPFTVLGTAMATYAGQNFGAHRPDRIEKGLRVAMLYSCIMWAVCFAVAYFFGASLTSLFIDPSVGDGALYFDRMLLYGSYYLIAESTFFPILAAVYIYRNTLQGAGHPSVTIIGGILELAARVVTSALATKYLDVNLICITGPAAWIAADLFLVPAYYYYIRKTRRELSA